MSANCLAWVDFRSRCITHMVGVLHQGAPDAAGTAALENKITDERRAPHLHDSVTIEQVRRVYGQGIRPKLTGSRVSFGAYNNSNCSSGTRVLVSFTGSAFAAAPLPPLLLATTLQL